MGLSLKQGLRRLATESPVTAIIIVAATTLFAAVHVLERRGDKEAYRTLGAVSTLEIRYRESPDGPILTVPQLNGHFDLWDGEWWRIVVTGFHHGGILHLVMNSLSIAALGWLLEPRVGSWRYLLFFLAGTTVSMLPETLLGHDAVGLSGGVFALFGALLVLRRRDRFVAEALPPKTVQLGLLWLVGCVVATQLGIVAIANAAHFAGFIYGWIAGQVFFGAVLHSRIARWSFVGAHLLLFPAFDYAIHPSGNGVYQWYLARKEDDRALRIPLLQAAVERDASLRLAWDDLATALFLEGRHVPGWKSLVEGLYHNRSNDHGVKLAHLMWQDLDDDERQIATETVREVFGDDAPAWEARLRPADDPFVEKLRSALRAFEKSSNKSPPKEPGVKKDLSAPPIDPNDPESASEGVGL